MSQLLDFYLGNGADTQGRRLVEICQWDDDQLEEVHDFIQWLFPLPQSSQFNLDAPLLSQVDIAAFESDPALRKNLLTSFERILRFLGLSEEKGGSIAEGANFTARAPDVWLAPNHNWLRITRILRSLCLLGCRTQAQALLAWLEKQYTRRMYPITSESFAYWQAAVKDANWA
jgi:hypothetical protein